MKQGFTDTAASINVIWDSDFPRSNDRPYSNGSDRVNSDSICEEIWTNELLTADVVNKILGWTKIHLVIWSIKKIVRLCRDKHLVTRTQVNYTLQCVNASASLTRRTQTVRKNRGEIKTKKCNTKFTNFYWFRNIMGKQIVEFVFFLFNGNWRIFWLRSYLLSK